MVNTLLAVFLQEPVKHGGYGFSPLQTAACKSFEDPCLITLLLTNPQSAFPSGLELSWHSFMAL